MDEEFVFNAEPTAFPTLFLCDSGLYRLTEDGWLERVPDEDQAD